MKVLLKSIFLFASLISSVVAVSNSSLPLLENDLTIGHNGSELVERKQETRIFLSGGM